MATPDKKRKSTRHFNLEKRGGHSFDLEKEEIAPAPTTKTPEPSPTVSGTPDSGASNGGGSNKWMLIIGIILIVAIIVWLCVRSCSSDNHEVPNEPEVEAVEPSFSVTDGSEETPVEEVGQSSTEEATEVEVSTEEASVPAQETATPKVEETANATSNSVSTNTSVDNTSKPQPTSAVSSDIEAEAMKVIRGEYGIGQQRKNQLGNKYQPIQSRVNELKRQGAF